MENNNKMIYRIYINNVQFSCIFEAIKNEKNIPSILGFPNLNFIKKEEIDNNIKLYYQLNELVKIRVNFNGIILFEKLFPLSISLKRLRDLLSVKLNKNFNFLFNNQIIQSQEESSFCLKNIIKDDILFLNDDEFNFMDIKEENPNLNINKDCISNLDKKETNIQEPKNNIKSKLKTEVEYKLFNNNSLFNTINISPEISLNDLREKIIDLIPRRTVFLMEDKEIDPSQEEKLLIKTVAKNNIINFQFPIEDKSNPIESEIFVNGKSYIKKAFYLSIQLKHSDSQAHVLQIDAK
jgi:hypothetical protein